MRGISGVLRSKFVRKGLVPYIFFELLGPPVFAATTIAGAGGITAAVDPGGSYDVWVAKPGWHFGGNIGSPLSNIGAAMSGDAIGMYSEIAFDFQTDSPRHGAVRVYANQPVVLFTITYPSAAPNTFSFPNWSQIPQSLNHLTYSGIFAPPSFNSASNEGPWAFFDSSANTFIVSPAGHFMVSTTNWGPNGELSSGISTQIATLPQGFQQRSFLVIEPGINRAFDTWGRAMTAFFGKARPSNDADTSLNKIGYWTDNGATYYYHTADGLSYEQTLSGIKSNFDRLGIGLGYIQLDSWFYPKGPNANWSANGNGIFQYVAAPALFPESLAGFQRNLGVSLITHARWIDPSSPYHQMYKMSGNVVTDPLYWNSTAAYLAASGVTTYEQDWLDDKAHTDFNLTDPELFLDNMAVALAQRGLTVQYCMASPRHFLQSVKHNNVTTIRTSEDRFVPARWTNFLYTSRLASALGLWPFTDVLMSTEIGSLLVATLSGGPVGIGDPIDGISAPNLLRAARADGVIVKPDVPLTPIDSSFFSAARAPDLTQVAGAQIAAAHTDFGDLRTFYVFAYTQAGDATATFQPSDLGLDRSTYLYDYFGGSGRVVNPSDTVSMQTSGGMLYLIAAPVGPSGIAMLGDLGQFVSAGKKRVTALGDNGAVHVTVAFASGEKSRILTGYSPAPPLARAVVGTADPVKFDTATQRFQILVTAGADGTASLRIEQPRPRAPLTPLPPNGSIQ
jgi:hypothetical protein